MKIGILVDTTSDLDVNIVNNKNIKIVPLQIIFDDMRNFRDVFEIGYEETLKAIDEHNAKTSLPLGEDVIKAFDEFVEEGYTHVFVLSLSETLSGTHNLIKNISDNYSDRLTIENVSTKTTTWAIGHVVLEALKLIEEGKTFEEVSKYINDTIVKNEIFFAVETLKYLIRGGRLGKLSGTIGEALDIKPILTLTKEGEINSIEKVRGRKKSIAKIISYIDERKNDIKKVYVLHINRYDEAIQLKEKLEEFLNVELEIKTLGTLVAVHTGEGLIGTVIIKK